MREQLQETKLWKNGETCSIYIYILQSLKKSEIIQTIVKSIILSHTLKYTRETMNFVNQVRT